MFENEANKISHMSRIASGSEGVNPMVYWCTLRLNNAVTTLQRPGVETWEHQTLCSWVHCRLGQAEVIPKWRLTLTVLETSLYTFCKQSRPTSDTLFVMFSYFCKKTPRMSKWIGRNSKLEHSVFKFSALRVNRGI